MNTASNKNETPLAVIAIGGNSLIFCIDFDKGALNSGTAEHEDIDQMSVKESRQYLEDGHFAIGSMRPEIEATVSFLKSGGDKVIISQPHNLEGALRGIHGTHIVA